MLEMWRLFHDSRADRPIQSRRQMEGIPVSDPLDSLQPSGQPAPTGLGLGLLVDLLLNRARANQPLEPEAVQAEYPAGTQAPIWAAANQLAALTNEATRRAEQAELELKQIRRKKRPRFSIWMLVLIGLVAYAANSVGRMSRRGELLKRYQQVELREARGLDLLARLHQRVIDQPA